MCVLYDIFDVTLYILIFMFLFTSEILKYAQFDYHYIIFITVHLL